MALRSRVRNLLDSARPNLAARVALSPLTLAGKVYGSALKARRDLYASGTLKSVSAAIPVISVGNLTVGGTGKTPLVELICRLLLAEGLKPVVISRGYRGRLEGKVEVVSDGGKIRLGAEDAGDEPLLMARRLPGVPVVIGAKRAKAVAKAVELGLGDVAVLDDGFQHLALKRDLDILLVDAAKPFGNLHCLPRGTLREPRNALAYADVVVLTRANRVEATKLDALKRQIAKMNPKALVFGAAHEPEALVEWPRGPAEEPKAIARKKVLAFAGIGRPEGFYECLRELGGVVAHTVDFEDHHPYSRDDVERIVHWARLTNAEALVTTEKDAVRLERFLPLDLPLLVLAVRVSLNGGEAEFGRKLAEVARAGRKGEK